MDTKRCSKCDIPLKASKALNWRGDRVLKMGEAGAFLFEVDNLRFLFDSLEKFIGASLNKIIIEAYSESAEESIKNILKGWRVKAMGKFGFLLNILPLGFWKKVFTEESQIYGFGLVEPEEFSWKKKAVLKVKYCPYVSFCGMYKGALSSLWGTPIKMDLKEEGSLIKVYIRLAERKKEKFSYLTPPKRPVLTDDIKYDLCSNCGSPLAVAEHFQWDWKNGFILYKESKRRWLLLTYNFPRVFIALEKEITQYIPKIVSELQQEYTVNNFLFPEALKEKNPYSKIFDQFLWGVLGWGNPVDVKKEGEVLRVRIDNPFYEPVLAGFIGGAYEIVEKRWAGIKWTPNTDGYTIITVKPKS